MSGAGAPPVSVVVPFYGDGLAALDRLLGSLARQDYAGEAEVIVVDNNPARRLPATRDDAPLRILHEPAPGSYAARNAALAVARGRVLAFTDADCECAPDWLSRGVAALADPAVGVVGGAIVARPARPDDPRLAERYDGFFHMRQAHYVAAMGFAATANCFTRHELFARLGPFDARLLSGGDREWCRRATAAGHRLAYAADAVVHHAARALPGLVTKARRLAGQEWSDAQAARTGIAGAMRAELRYFRGRVRRLLDRDEPLDGLDRAAFLGLATVVQAVRVAEVVKLSLVRASPERR